MRSGLLPTYVIFVGYSQLHLISYRCTVVRSYDIIPLLISTGFLKYPIELKKKFLLELKFLSQFELNAEMDISKNQWRPTGG